jgi:anti-sigma factor RsiW
LSCLDEGQLQSWIDGELAPDAKRSAVAHLAACPKCSVALEELQANAAEVAAKFEALSDSLPHEPILYISRRRWPAAAAAGALAASLALVAILQRPSAPAPEPAGQFLPLTDEPDPMQAGMLVRVNVPASVLHYTGVAPASGMVQAEVIVGEDGRPRAVRFLPQ